MRPVKPLVFLDFLRGKRYNLIMTYKELFEKYPHAFLNNRNTDYSEDPSYRFECAEGWADLMEPIFAYLHEMNTKHPEDLISISQIKEKFGTLRFYTSGSTEKLSALIDAAEQKSSITCEVCGKAGSLDNSRHWIQTLCEQHKKERTR